MGANISKTNKRFDNILDNKTNMYCNTSAACMNVIEGTTAGSINQRGFAGSHCGMDMIKESTHQLIDEQTVEQAASWIPGANVQDSKTELVSKLNEYIDANCTSSSAIENVIRNATVTGHINQYCNAEANCASKLISSQLQKSDSKTKTDMTGSGLFGPKSEKLVKYIAVIVVALVVLGIIGGVGYFAINQKQKKKKQIQV